MKQLHPQGDAPNDQHRAPARFAARGAFAKDLDEAATAYFETIGGERRDAPAMYLKSAVILGWFALSWVLLVFVASGWLQGLASAVSLGLAIAGVGMSVQHDANHGAYSKHAWVNRFFGSTLDLMGVSSFIWRPKHNVAHHTFTNVEAVDFDLDFGPIARLSPAQERRSWHRYQQLYLWVLYGFLLPKWVFWDDFVVWRTKRIGIHALPARRVSSWASFVGWKVAFVLWAIAIPALYHPLWQVLVFHFVAAFTLGATLGTVFQLAHCTQETTFLQPCAETQRMATDWSTHQLATTADFAGGNRALTWFCGGLNYQVEHHLFPKVSHIHYPALSRVVTAVATRHGLAHRRSATLRGALASHYAHLRDLGRAPVLP